jgi:branched-chain amino acid transport system ATP-binding protein
MSQPILEASGVSKSYGSFRALESVDLRVDEGEIHAVIGPNGAGKTTLFAVISGELRPTQGVVRFGGHDVTRVPAWQRTRQGMVRSFQIVRIFSTFTVRENVHAAVLAGHRRTWLFHLDERRVGLHGETDRLLDESQLAPLADARASQLSQGDRKRLEMAMALALDPRLLLLDEPTAGMSPAETAQTVALVREMWRRHGCAVLLTEHDMSVIFELASRITVLHQGRVLVSGEPEAIARDPRVLEVYLGQGLES